MSASDSEATEPSGEPGRTKTKEEEVSAAEGPAKGDRVNRKDEVDESVSVDDDGGRNLSYLASEIRVEWDQIRDRRARQIQYLHMYMVALGVLLATAAYGIDSGASFSPSDMRAYGIFGMIIWLIVLSSGCCFTWFLGHNFRGIVVGEKNIAALRKAAGVNVQFCSEVDPCHVRIPESYSTGHYWMALVNMAVALGCVYFLKWAMGTWTLGLEIGLCILSFVVFFYPRVCIAFNRYMVVASKVRPAWPESRVRRAYRRTHQQRKRVIGILHIAYALMAMILACAIVFNMALLLLGRWVAVSTWITVASVIWFVSMAILRYTALRREFIVVRSRAAPHFVQ